MTDTSPNAVLAWAAEQRLREVLVIGQRDDGALVVASAAGHAEQVKALLEAALRVLAGLAAASSG